MVSGVESGAAGFFRGTLLLADRVVDGLEELTDIASIEVDFLGGRNANSSMSVSLPVPEITTDETGILPSSNIWMIRDRVHFFERTPSGRLTT